MLNPEPITLHPQPRILNPPPSILNPEHHQTLDPKCYQIEARTRHRSQMRFSQTRLRKPIRRLFSSAAAMLSRLPCTWHSGYPLDFLISHAGSNLHLSQWMSQSTKLLGRAVFSSRRTTCSAAVCPRTLVASATHAATGEKPPDLIPFPPVVGTRLDRHSVKRRRYIYLRTPHGG